MGNACAEYVDPALIRSSVLRARVDVAEVSRYSAAGAQNMLDKLLDGGHITPAQYVRRLPAGLLMDRQALIEDMEGEQTVPTMGKEVGNGS